MTNIVLVLVLVLFLEIVSAFRPIINSQIRKVNGARSMTAVFDALAGMALATKLQTSAINPSALTSRSMPVAVVETRQGMYKDYTVDIKDDSALDKVKRNYKTAEETDDSKSKYWAIFAVLLVGSFVIPMVQYYWYVAEEDDE